jgi:peptidoglycan/xylan/chitin deacetylase (PgdA/CDA1 family)
VVRIGATDRRVVAFTFDAGSDAGYTSLILDTLADNGITAYFGLTGKWAEANPPLARRIVDEGHGLINHSYDHSSFTGLSTGQQALTREQRWEQLQRTEQILGEASGGTTIPYFRPPYGDYDESVNVDIGAVGYRYNVMWTVDSGGWRGISAGEIKQRCLDGAEPGAIYVFHVGSGSRDGPALQTIIDGLRADGYAFLPLNEILPGQ